MANATSTSAPNTYPTFGAIGYIVMGTISGVSNLLIAFSIAKYSALRQLNQYIILMALALGDALWMLGSVAAGVYRLYLIANDGFSWQMHPATCFLLPHIPSWLFAQKFANLMLVVISVDRLFLVVKPEAYVLRLPSPQYALTFVLSALGFTTIMGSCAVIAVLLKEPDVRVGAMCYFPGMIQNDKNLWARAYIFYHRNSSAFVLTSVIIFAAILPIHKFKNNSSSTMTVEQQAALKAQRRMTTSLALSCACTLGLFCIPYELYPVAWRHGYYRVTWSLIVLTMTNSLANLFIYQLRHAEMRVALSGLLKGKQLPVLLNLWPTAKNSVHPQAEGRLFELAESKGRKAHRSTDNANVTTK